MAAVARRRAEIDRTPAASPVSVTWTLARCPVFAETPTVQPGSSIVRYRRSRSLRYEAAVGCETSSAFASSVLIAVAEVRWAMSR